MRHKHTLSIIIVSWNVRDLLLNTLKTLYQFNPSLDFEVHVIDNNSSDDSVEQVRSHFPQVHLVENESNLGFAKANNQGISAANSNFILLLNPDTICVDDSITRMVNFLSKNSKVGMLGPKILNSDKRTIQYWCARRLPQPVDVFFEDLKLSKLFPRHKFLNRQLMGEWNHLEEKEVECLSGACLMVRLETIREIGGLDEDYPLYWEDTDWCLRVRKSKWKILYLPQTKIIHIGGQSSLKSEGSAFVKSIKGCLRYFLKFHSKKDFFRVWWLLRLSTSIKVLLYATFFFINPFKLSQYYAKINTLLNVFTLKKGDFLKNRRQ